MMQVERLTKSATPSTLGSDIDPSHSLILEEYTMYANLYRNAAAALPAFLAVTLITPLGVQAQIRASERGSVSQTIDGTTITIDYGRPQTRGRSNLYGGEVPWGKVWTPGANWATTIDVTSDVSINDNPLAQGTYSVWFEVQPEAWTVILDPVPRRFHLMPPPVLENQVRFTVYPDRGSQREVLTWEFPAVQPTGAKLAFSWGDASVSFDIDVQPSLPVTVTAELARRYVGNYTLQRRGPLGSGSVQFDVEYLDNKLVATWESAPNPNLAKIWLVSLGAGMFAPAELHEGELFDIVMDLVFEFPPTGPRADSFELRALGDALWGTGTRNEK